MTTKPFKFEELARARDFVEMARLWMYEQSFGYDGLDPGDRGRLHDERLLTAYFAEAFEAGVRAAIDRCAKDGVQFVYEGSEYEALVKEILSESGSNGDKA